MPNGYMEPTIPGELYAQYKRQHPEWSQHQIEGTIGNMAGTTSTSMPYLGGSTYGQDSAGNPFGPMGASGGGAGAAGGASGSSGPTNAAQQWLNDVLSGKNLPFNAQVQAQQISQASDMNAAGESARNGQIDANAAAGGSSARDPSLQGAKAANFARRQTENQTSARDISQRGVAQNFSAQQNAAGELNNNQMQREGWAQQAALQRTGAQFSGGGSSRSRVREQSGNGFAFLPTGQVPIHGDAYETSLYNASKGSGTAYRNPGERAQDAQQNDFWAGNNPKPKGPKDNPAGGGFYGSGGTTYGGVDYSNHTAN